MRSWSSLLAWVLLYTYVALTRALPTEPARNALETPQRAISLIFSEDFVDDEDLRPLFNPRRFQRIHLTVFIGGWKDKNNVIQDGDVMVEILGEDRIIRRDRQVAGDRPKSSSSADGSSETPVFFYYVSVKDLGVDRGINRKPRNQVTKMQDENDETHTWNLVRESMPVGRTTYTNKQLFDPATGRGIITDVWASNPVYKRWEHGCADFAEELVQRLGGSLTGDAAKGIAINKLYRRKHRNEFSLVRHNLPLRIETFGGTDRILVTSDDFDISNPTRPSRIQRGTMLDQTHDHGQDSSVDSDETQDHYSTADETSQPNEADLVSERVIDSDSGYGSDVERAVESPRTMRDEALDDVLKPPLRRLDTPIPNKFDIAMQDIHRLCNKLQPKYPSFSECVEDHRLGWQGSQRQGRTEETRSF
ncbi:MAG: hypothetical protein M1825_004699 [Sarcosagium campestre]|nr:MAG: hypothetical protein M1825_004699 [Sarcosagium campestre]